jgi:glycosyltransferase involved in cell wall biosynthesis
MNVEKNRSTISVITATYNTVSHLPRLIDSLRQQSDKDFEWVVADGASTDGTLELLKSVGDINVVISSQEDFGIYDALNRAVKMTTGDYYIVSGADDCFYPDAIANFRRAIEQSGADMVVANAIYENVPMQVKRGPAWIYGHASYVSAHVLATAFRKNLHDTFGFYSRKYPLAADQLFVLQACENGISRYRAEFLAGEIGSAGVSSMDRVGCATELFRVQLALGKAMFPQLVLFLLRLARASLPSGQVLAK